MKTVCFRCSLNFIANKAFNSEKRRWITTSSKLLDSVSSEEVQKFSNFANTWWDENGSMKALHQMNDLRVPFIRDNLLYQGLGKMNCSKPLQGINLLDIGCGGGILSEALARLGASVLAIDANEDAIEAAKKHRGEDRELEDLQYLDILLEDVVSIGSLKFDCVVGSEVMEHVENQEEFIQMCSTVLKPNGSLFVSTINRTSLSYGLGILLAENVLGILPPGTHDWNKFITPEEISTWMQNADLHLNKIHGMAYIPGIERWKWIGNTDINYILHSTKNVVEETVETDDSAS